MKKPNLLFIYTDEQAAETMRAYGNDVIKTPNMDKLAEDSVLFKNTYVTQPICTPSRSTILTGLYPHTSGCTENNVPLREDTKCFPELGDFKGYKTAHYGKWHLGDEVFAQHGFDEWKSIEDMYREFYSSGKDRFKLSEYAEFLKTQGFKPDRITQDGFEYFSREFCARIPEKYSKPAYLGKEAGDFIKRNKDDPFILYVNFLEPHMPFFGPRDGQYDPEDVVLPKSFDHETGCDVPLKYRIRREVLYNRGHGDLPLRSEKDWKRIIANYYGLISLVDTYLGEIINTLEEYDLYENTMIVFTSDHGDMMGAHRLLAKCVMYEEAIKVPLLMKFPGMEHRGKVIEEPVSQIDLVPTLLQAMSQSVPKNLEGYSWIPCINGSGDLVEKDIFVQWNGNTGEVEFDPPIITIITPEGWKYNYCPQGINELYDLNSDPHEMNNLYGENKNEFLITRLEQKIMYWQERTGHDSV